MSWVLGTAWAGPRLIIEHPRYPYLQKDVYSVNCDQKCVVKISSEDPFSGATKLPLLQNKILSLMERMSKKEFPDFPESPRILYEIVVEDGKKKLEWKVGYPKSYRGADYTKFNDLIDAIDELKFIMRKSELKE